MAMRNLKNVPFTSTSTRAIFGAVIAVTLLCSVSAQATSFGDWRERYEESQKSSNLFAKIFDGRSSFGDRYESSSSNDSFSHELKSFDFSKLIALANEWVEKYRSERYELVDVKPTDGAYGATPVPEPAAALLFAIGIGVVATRRRI